MPNDPEQWNQVPLWAACEALPYIEERPDILIIDEAQDFVENEWLFIEELSANASTWVFYDPAQAFCPERKLPKWVEESFRFRLRQSYRCPAPIMEFSKALHGQDYDKACVRKGFEENALGIVGCPSISSVEKKIGTEIQKLRSEGFSAGDIAVISLRGRSAKDGIACRDHVGEYPLVRADDPEMEEQVVGDTFLRFKGLERPAVIVTDLRLVQNRLDVRMHIALTRALDVVRIVGPMQEIEKLEIEDLSQACGS